MWNLPPGCPSCPFQSCFAPISVTFSKYHIMFLWFPELTITYLWLSPLQNFSFSIFSKEITQLGIQCNYKCVVTNFNQTVIATLFLYSTHSHFLLPSQQKTWSPISLSKQMLKEANFLWWHPQIFLPLNISCLASCQDKSSLSSSLRPLFLVPWCLLRTHILLSSFFLVSLFLYQLAHTRFSVYSRFPCLKTNKQNSTYPTFTFTYYTLCAPFHNQVFLSFL